MPAPAPKIETCKTCKWFQESVKTGGTPGECHRYPPTIYLQLGPIEDRSSVRYPDVKESVDWCGEWEKK